MKHLLKHQSLKSVMTLVIFTLMQTAILAQESTTESNTTTSTVKVSTEQTGNKWYSSPLLWVAGAALFIILLISLMRGSKSKTTTANTSTDRVTVTKTVERDTDTV